jgi:quinol monooxygenase YgiN
MPVRLVITTYAKPGKGAELAQAMADRCRAVQQEPGCQQFEVFQSALDTDKLVVHDLEGYPRNWGCPKGVVL